MTDYKNYKDRVKFVKEYYPNDKWSKKVDNMKRRQVEAIFISLKKRDEKKIIDSINDEYHQMTLLEWEQEILGKYI